MKMAKKSLLMRVIGVMAAATCAVTITATFVPKSDMQDIVYAAETGTEVPMTQDATNADVFYLDCTAITSEDVGNTITVTFESSSTYAGWGCNGCCGYSDASGWNQTDWEASADSNGTVVVEVPIEVGMVGNSDIQIQCWTPGGSNVTGYSAVFEPARVEETTTSDTTTTTTIDPDDTTTTTTITTTTDTDDTATTTTTDTDDTTTTTNDTTTTTTTTTTTSDTTTTTTTSDTTTTTTTTVTLDTKIDFIQTKDADGNPCVEIDTMGADSVTVVMKVLTNDTEATLAFCGVYDGEWSQKKYEGLSVASDKTVTQSYTIPNNLDGLLKIASYWPTSVTFQSITLHYNEPPVVTTTATTTTIAGDKVPTYTTTIGIKDKTNKEEIQIDLNDIVYVVVSAEGQVGKKISGAMYAGGDEIVWQDEIVDETGLYIIDYVNVNREAYASYQIYYNNGQDVTNVSYKAYKRYDASLNDKVNASDILAILKYIRGTERNTVQDIVCDINEDGVVKMNDAVALVKYILGTETAE